MISKNKITLKDIAFFATQCYASKILKLFLDESAKSIYNFEMRDV